MKKICVLAVLFSVVLFSAYSQGFYLDLGLGYGKTWTFAGDANIVDSLTSEEPPYSDFGLDLGMKIGFKLKESPVFIVLTANGLGHRLYNPKISEDFYQIN